MSNPIDEYYKRELEKVEIKPSADLWKQKIEPQIDSKKAAPVYWYRVAAAIALLLGAVFTWQFLEPNATSINPNMPVAVEIEPTVLPEVLILIPAPELKMENLAEAEEKPAGTKKPVVFEKRAMAEVSTTKEEPKNLAEPEPVQPKTKPKYKIALSINSLKYAETTVPVEQQNQEKMGEERQGTSLGDYAKSQWSNIKAGDKLNAPPKEWFNLPKLALRVEGNPVKGVLNPGEE